MTKRERLAFCAVLALACFACASGPSSQEIAAADYGAYPSQYVEVVKTYMGAILKDPSSAQYDFLNEPKKGWNNFRGLAFGWVVCANINAKNGFGGYTGRKPYYFLIKGDRVVKRLGGGDKYEQAGALSACNNSQLAQVR